MDYDFLTWLIAVALSGYNAGGYLVDYKRNAEANAARVVELEERLATAEKNVPGITVPNGVDGS